MQTDFRPISICKIQNMICKLWTTVYQEQISGYKSRKMISLCQVPPGVNFRRMFLNPDIRY